MRLTSTEIKIIKECIKEVLKEGKVILFGSRVYDNKRGGDIDLCVEIDRKVSLGEKFKILNLLEDRGIERKVDLIFKYPTSEGGIFKTIEKEGIKL